MRDHQLRDEARSFADQLAGLLNGTICHGVRLTVVPAADHFVIGFGLSETILSAERGIPVTTSNLQPNLWLDLSFRLSADDSGEHVMAVSSFMGIFKDADLQEPLLHYDYERHKPNGYPEAHIQVVAEADRWRAVLDGKPLAHIHLPVGGRRYRPILEDLVEFLIVEKLVTSYRPDWADKVHQGREKFCAIQLKAAVRQDPQTALDALAALGWRLTLVPSQRTN